MHVTACLAGQKVEVEVGEECRTLQALQEAVVEALPQLCVEGFDVSVGGRALDDDEGVVSLTEDACLDVVANTRGLSVLALREAGREVSEAGLLKASEEGDVALCTLYLDAGVLVACVDDEGCTPLHHSKHLSVATLLLDRGCPVDKKCGGGMTPLHYSCATGDVEMATLLVDRGTAVDERFLGATPLFLACCGQLDIATLLLDRGSTAIDEPNRYGDTPLHRACRYLDIATLLLDRGSTAIDAKNVDGVTPLLYACHGRYLECATLLLDRGSNAIDEADAAGNTPLLWACRNDDLPLVTLLLDRGCSVPVKKYKRSIWYSQAVLQLLSERGHDVLLDDPDEERS